VKADNFGILDFVFCLRALGTDEHDQKVCRAHTKKMVQNGTKEFQSNDINQNVIYILPQIIELLSSSLVRSVFSFRCAARQQVIQSISQLMKTIHCIF
jgi:hypothetical protein